MLRRRPRQEEALLTNFVDVAVGRALATRRRVLGLGQMDVARLVGASENEVSQYEAGSVRVPAARLFELTRRMEMPVRDLYRSVLS